MKLDKFKEILKDFVKIKSVSGNKDFKAEIDNCVDFLIDLFTELGFDTKVIEGNSMNPYVFAEFKVSNDAKTVLVYGHYDVQPANVKDGWDSKPFTLIERNGRLFGRGVVDNKGQVLTHILGVGSLIESGNLKCNVKFFIEGNEETANADIANVIAKNKDLLKCDAVLVSDGEMTNEQPTIEIGFRGGANVKITFETAKNDVHSGLFGGAFPNAATELSTLIAKFYDVDNKVKIPGFYEGVDKVTKAELENNKSINFDFKKIQRITGVKELKMEKGKDFYTQTGLLPMLTITGFKSGYIGEGFNNIIPCKAEAKINFRFASSQNPKKILRSFEEFVKQNTPSCVNCTIEIDSMFDPIKLSVNESIFTEAKKILEAVYKDKVLYKYVGASIPVISDFINILKKPVLSIPLANEDCNMHGVDENFKGDLVEKGLEFSRKFFEN